MDQVSVNNHKKLLIYYRVTYRMHVKYESSICISKRFSKSIDTLSKTSKTTLFCRKNCKKGTAQLDLYWHQPESYRNRFTILVWYHKLPVLFRRKVVTFCLLFKIYHEAKKFGKAYNIRVVCAYGGGSLWEQCKACEEGAEIIVATPVSKVLSYSSYAQWWFNGWIKLTLCVELVLSERKLKQKRSNNWKNHLVSTSPLWFAFAQCE